MKNFKTFEQWIKENKIIIGKDKPRSFWFNVYNLEKRNYTFIKKNFKK